MRCHARHCTYTGDRTSIQFACQTLTNPAFSPSSFPSLGFPYLIPAKVRVTWPLKGILPATTLPLSLLRFGFPNLGLLILSFALLSTRTFAREWPARGAPVYVFLSSHLRIVLTVSRSFIPSYTRSLNMVCSQIARTKFFFIWCVQSLSSLILFLFYPCHLPDISLTFPIDRR